METILQNLNFRTTARNVLSTFLVAVFFITTSQAQMRGRVQIQNGNVVAENGTTLRAAPFFVDIDWGIPHMLDNEQTYRDYFRTVSQDHNMNMVRACPWLGRFDYMMDDVVNSSTGETAGDRVTRMLDLIVDWAEEDGIYVLINAHSQIGTTMDFNKWRSFWDLIAPRYKNKTHVFYEATNEPEENSAINNMESMYNHIRGMAPNTHISLWSHWNAGFTIQTIQSKSGINYSNASVGFHTYLSEGDLAAWDRARDIRDAGFPVICTELWSLTNANDLPIDYNELSLHIQRGEQLGMSWSQWGPYANYRGFNPSPEFDNPHDQIKFTSQYRSSIENRGVTYWARDNGTGGSSGGGNNGGGSNSDEISSTTVPSSVNPGQQVTVQVQYSASTNRDIQVVFQRNQSPWTNYGSKTTQVSAGSGTLNVTINIDSNTPIANDAYQFQTFITNSGGGYPGQSNLNKNNIDCVQSSGGNSGGGNGSGDITIRARGNCGSETLQLRVNGTAVRTWNNISTSESNYTYSGYSGGDINVHFTNDGNDGCDRNMFVNYIDVCGTRYQTENTASRTGCGDGQWLWCTGNFAFGNLGCSTSGGNTGGGNSGGGNTGGTYFYVKNKATNKYLRPDHAGETSWLRVQDKDNSDIYKWKKVSTNNGYFYLQNKSTGMYFRPITSADGSRVEQRSTGNTDNWTQWKEISKSDGSVHLENRQTGKFIRPTNNGSDTNLELRPNTWTGDWTRWFFESAGARKGTEESQELQTLSIKAYQSTENTLTISGRSFIDIQLFNLTGQLKWESPAESDFYNVDITGFESGIYLIKSFSETGIETKKLILK